MAQKTGESRPPGNGGTEGEQRSGRVAGTALIAGVTFARKAVQYAEVDGLAMFEGDIILGTIADLKAAPPGAPVQFAVGISGQQFRWPNGVVHYDIDPALPNQQRVTDAIAHWEANTRLRFVLRTPANAGTIQDWVRFQPGGGCSSHVGRRGGMQTITLGSGCSTGNAIHEIGHAVGLWHEQSREDRDTFVDIVWANIDAAMQHNFDQHVTDGDDLGAYDFGSIMHYPATAFSINGQATIVPRQALPPGVVMGQRTGLSAGDIAGVHAMYPAIPTFKEVGKDPLTEPIKHVPKDPWRETFKEVPKDPIRDTLKEIRKDPIRDTAKEIGKDPIRDTAKEIRKDPIPETVKEIRKDPFKEVPKDPIVDPWRGGAKAPVPEAAKDLYQDAGLKAPVVDPQAAPPYGPTSPFVLAVPSGWDAQWAEALAAATAQVQQLAEALSALEAQQAELLAAYQAAVQELDQLQGGLGST